MANVMPAGSYEYDKRRIHQFAKHTDLVSMFPDCSISHITKEDNEYLQAAAAADRDNGDYGQKYPFCIAEYREGYFFWFFLHSDQKVFDKIEGLPFSDSLKQVLHRLYDYFEEPSSRGDNDSVTLSLRIDADGYEYDGIPTHEW